MDELCGHLDFPIICANKPALENQAGQ